VRNRVATSLAGDCGGGSGAARASLAASAADRPLPGQLGHPAGAIFIVA
jgi:hypothetical protein